MSFIDALVALALMNPNDNEGALQGFSSRNHVRLAVRTV